MTDREAFCCAVANGPMLPAATIFVPSGDGTTRLEVALGLLRQRAAHWTVVSGGVDDEPHALSSAASEAFLIERGLSPDRVIRDEALNTHEQAEALVRLATEHEWGRVLVPVSPYHMYRWMLTAIASLKAAGIDEKVHVLPVSASQTTWWRCPEGLETTRMDLLAVELAKIDEYREKGHVASWTEGLDYLRHWERL